MSSVFHFVLHPIAEAALLVAIAGSSVAWGLGAGPADSGALVDFPAAVEGALYRRGTDAAVRTSASPARPETCAGDCNHDSLVTVDELVTMIGIALGDLSLLACGAGDSDGDGRITVDEILAAAQNALAGCGPAVATATASVAVSPTRTPSPLRTATRSATPTRAPSTRTPTAAASATATATVPSPPEGRLVSDLLLARRWPNGIIPYKFAANDALPDSATKKARVLAAMRGSTTIAGCTGPPCVGWGGVPVVRFVECPEDEHCGPYPYYALIIIGEENKTVEKRGFASLTSTDLDPRACPNGMQDLLAGTVCRRTDCNPEVHENCVFDIWVDVDSQRGFMWNAVHEFGHLLGFQHEQFRPDRDDYIDTSACAGVAEWTSEKHLLDAEEFIGTYDVRSAMHYVDQFNPGDLDVVTCFTSKPGAPIGYYRNDDMPTVRDLAKLQLLYGVRGDWLIDGDWCIRSGREVHLGDFNGDGRADLLCHSATAGFDATGRRWLDYANDAGEFNGTNWSSGSEQYCWGDGRRLLVGDFDGDGDDDTLCHNNALGTVTIDYTNALGELNGQDWPASGTQSWNCRGTESSVHVGDFNGDGRDDLLCHDSGSGVRWIDWADEEAHFLGADWSSEDAGTRSWCVGASERIFIGDFNRDGRDDALCHDTVLGHRKIDYASVDGDLKGTNWSSLDTGAWPFCWGSNTLIIADVNGDGADDLLCHDDRTGFVSVDLARPEDGTANGSGLRGSNWSGELAFCNAQDGQLLAGAFDPDDMRADLLCHNRVSGHKAILYARTSGFYAIPAGY